MDDLTQNDPSNNQDELIDSLEVPMPPSADQIGFNRSVVENPPFSSNSQDTNSLVANERQVVEQRLSKVREQLVKVKTDHKDQSNSEESSPMTELLGGAEVIPQTE